MNTIRELKQKGEELASRIAKFGAPIGNKNAAGPHDRHGGKNPVASSGRRLVTEKPDGKNKTKIILNGWNQGHIIQRVRKWEWVSSSGGNGNAVSKQDAIAKLLAANKS